MTDKEIIVELKDRLNQEGKTHNLNYTVSDNSTLDGEWTMFFVEVNESRRNSAASRQIIQDIEDDLVKKSGREIIIIITKANADAVGM